MSCCASCWRRTSTSCRISTFRLISIGLSGVFTVTQPESDAATAAPAISRRFDLRFMVIGSLAWLGFRGHIHLLLDWRDVGLLVFFLPDDAGLRDEPRRIEREWQDRLDYAGRILEALGHLDQR